jgi:hypothetical protein
MLRYLPIGKEAVIEDMKGCIGAEEIDALASRLRPLFSDEYSSGTRDVAAQLSSLDMTESNIRLLVLSEFSEFFNLLS